MKKFLDPEKENYFLEKSKIVILPVPFDGTSTWLKGADKGPEAIISASSNLETYDIETNFEVYNEGIYTADPVREKSSPEILAKKVEKATEKYIQKGKFVALLGGEHSVSIGSIKAHARHFQNLSVLQLDAHSDLRQEYMGSKYNHACVMARAREICPVVQVGIRSIDASERKFIDKKRVFFAEKIYNRKNWQKEVVKKLSSRVYVTIDLDVFDPGILPSTGTPEPGGLGWYQVLELLREVSRKKEIVGFDVVELCPNKYDKSSDFLTAKLVYKVLSYKFKREKKRKGVKYLF